jgi:hypothetical protein
VLNALRAVIAKNVTARALVSVAQGCACNVAEIAIAMTNVATTVGAAGATAIEIVQRGLTAFDTIVFPKNSKGRIATKVSATSK